MKRADGFWKEMCGGVGRSLLGFGGFWIDDEGRLIEEYDEDEEDWPEEIYSGYESQDGEDLGWSDCIWRSAECDHA